MIDSDGDNKVSFEEFVAYLKNVGQQYKALLDVHKQFELPEQPSVTLSLAQRKFNQLDKDGSGFLDVAEAKQFSLWIYSSFQTKVIYSVDFGGKLLQIAAMAAYAASITQRSWPVRAARVLMYVEHWLCREEN